MPLKMMPLNHPDNLSICNVIRPPKNIIDISWRNEMVCGSLYYFRDGVKICFDIASLVAIQKDRDQNRRKWNHPGYIGFFNNDQCVMDEIEQPSHIELGGIESDDDAHVFRNCCFSISWIY
jgi:hypothetical protein